MGGCCAPNCTNNSKKGKRCLVFPRNPERRAKWLQMCRRDKWQPTLYSTLCEVHIEESQSETSQADGWKKLKPNAVPTLFNVSNCIKQLTPKRTLIVSSERVSAKHLKKCARHKRLLPHLTYVIKQKVDFSVLNTCICKIGEKVLESYVVRRLHIHAKGEKREIVQKRKANYSSKSSYFSAVSSIV